jgi:hypothetical protein
LWTLKAALDPNDAPPWPNDPFDALFFLAPLLLAAGLSGFFAIYREKLKGLGQSGFTQGLIGLGLLAAGFFGAYTLGEEPLLRAASFGFFILAFGLVLIGYAAITEDALPGWNWLPFALGAVAPLGILVGVEPWLRVAISVLFGVGWVLFGVLVWRSAKETKDRESGRSKPKN